MYLIDPEILAAQDPKLSANDLQEKLSELKGLGYRLIECISYVKWNQGCALNEATHIVINSTAWHEQKVEFMQHQYEQWGDIFASMPTDTTMKITITPGDTCLNFLPHITWHSYFLDQSIHHRYWQPFSSIVRSRL